MLASLATPDSRSHDNMFMVAGGITVVGKLVHETVVRGVAQNIGIDSFIDDSSRVDNKGLHYQDSEVLFHVNKQRADMLRVCTSTEMTFTPEMVIFGGRVQTGRHR